MLAVLGRPRLPLRRFRAGRMFPGLVLQSSLPKLLSALRGQWPALLPVQFPGGNSFVFGCSSDSIHPVHQTKASDKHSCTPFSITLSPGRLVAGRDVPGQCPGRPLDLPSRPLLLCRAVCQDGNRLATRCKPLLRWARSPTSAEICHTHACRILGSTILAPRRCFFTVRASGQGDPRCQLQGIPAMKTPLVLILTHRKFLRYYRLGSQDRLTKYSRDESRRLNSMSSRRHENDNARNKRPGSTITD